MRKNFTLIAVFMLLISLVFVSCAPEKAVDDGNTMEIYFGHLEAKDVDTTAYTVGGSTTWGSTSVTVETADKYYWSYTAEKTDKLFTAGQQLTQTVCADGTGLGGSRTFSKGKWKFTLYAYASEADRTAGTQYLFSGSKEATYTETVNVSIPVSYSYIAGKGKVNFTIGTTIEQNTAGVNAGTDVGTYSITKVEAIIDGKTINLTKNTAGTSWTGTASDVASGAKDVGLNVYVTGTATGTTTQQKISAASSTKVGTAYVLHGLTTEVTGSAKVTLTAGTVGITFQSTLSGTSGSNPGQPDSNKLK